MPSENQKFCGIFKAKFSSVLIDSTGTNSLTGTAVINIYKIGKDAYAITTTTSDNKIFNDYGFIEYDVLRGELGTSNGIFSAYFKGKYLYLKISESDSSTKLVNIYKGIRCNCDC
jgi:hypothetical protein